MDFLNRVFKEEKKKEIMAILESPNPSHYQRLWMTGFLKYGCGYKNEEVCDIIHQYNRWTDYNESITKYQVEHVIKTRGKINLFTSF